MNPLWRLHCFCLRNGRLYSKTWSHVVCCTWYKKINESVMVKLSHWTCWLSESSHLCDVEFWTCEFIVLPWGCTSTCKPLTFTPAFYNRRPKFLCSFDSDGAFHKHYTNAVSKDYNHPSCQAHESQCINSVIGAWELSGIFPSRHFR